MNPFLLKRLSVMIGLLFFASPGYAQAENADAGPESSTSGLWRGHITPKFGYFDNSGNPAYLNRYTLLGIDNSVNAAYMNRDNLLDFTFSKGGASDGFIADLNFSLVFNDDSGASLFVEKEGYGANNQRCVSGGLPVRHFSARTIPPSIRPRARMISSTTRTWWPAGRIRGTPIAP